MTDTVLFKSIREAVVEGDAARSRLLAEEAVRAGLDPLVVLERGFTEALRHVGGCWERGDMYLPEMMLAAEAVKGAMEVLKPRLRAAVAARGSAASTCVLGTVKGDIHDIGKNIVGTLLEAFGFRIIDLGTDVAPERFVSAVRETKAELVGLSALLTSTMPEMRTIIAALQEAGLRGGLRVAVGGAPVTSSYAREIGADGYADEGIAALRLFQRLAAERAGAAAGREVHDAS
jgi:corrinoid protein of di/trimethylamine methyltransferase